MEIKRITTDEKETLQLSGRLDTSTAPQLQDFLLPLFDSAKQIELDFNELNYVSSAGLRVLLLGEKTSRSKSVSMTLVNVSQEVMDVFNMTGFNTLLNIK